MRKLLILVFLIQITFAAKLDETYFSLQNLEEIKKNILLDEKQKKRLKSILSDEKAYINRIEEVNNLQINFEKIALNQFEQKSLSIDFIYNALLNISNIKIKIDLQTQLLEKTNEKLSLLKNSIERIVEETKQYTQLYQLQYLYYKTQKKHIESNIQKYSEYNKNILILIQNNINKIKVENNDYKLSTINEHTIKISELQRLRSQKEIELEKEYVLGESSASRALAKSVYLYNEQIDDVLEKIVIDMFKRAINFLVLKDNKSFLNTLSQIDKKIELLKIDKTSRYKNKSAYVLDLGKALFGNTQLLLGSSIHHSKNMLKEIHDTLSRTLFVFNEKSITIFSITKSIVLIFIGFTIGILYKRWLMRLSNKWPNMSQMSLKLSSNIGFYIIILITIIVAMSSLGIDMSSISLIAGALSIGIGFGLQTVVSNFIAGIILMFERTIRIGDIVEINELLKGTVSDIRIRSTTIKTFDNIDIVVPNSSFIQNNVINWTLEDASRRLHVPFGVAYGTSVDKVKQVIIDELLCSGLKFINNDENKKPEIRMESMNTSSVDFELLVWIKANDKLQPNSLKSDFLILIYNALYKHNIEIPFPQLDLHIKKEKHEKT